MKIKIEVNSFYGIALKNPFIAEIDYDKRNGYSYENEYYHIFISGDTIQEIEDELEEELKLIYTLYIDVEEQILSNDAKELRRKFMSNYL